MNKQEYNKAESEINLEQLLFSILLKWRIIVLAMLIFALLFGLFGYKRSNSSDASKEEIGNSNTFLTVEAAKKHKEELEAILSYESIANVKTYQAFDKAYQDSLQYVQSSIFMQIDANEVKQYKIQFYIGLNEETKDAQEQLFAKAVMYKALLENEELYRKIEDEVGVETGNNYFNEIIELTIEYRTNTTTDANVINIINNLYSSKMNSIIEVKIIHYDGAMCKKIANVIIDYFNNKKSNIEQIAGPHNLTLLSSSYSQIADFEIIKKQKAIINDLPTLPTTSQRLKDELTEEELLYYNTLIKIDELVAGKPAANSAEPEIISDEAPLIFVIVKYVVMGSVLGAFLIVFFMFIQYMLNTKLMDEDDLQHLYGLRVIGILKKEQDKKIFSGIDNWLIHLRDRNKRKLTQAESFKIICSNIKINARKQSLSELSVVGCNLSEIEQSFIAKIQESLNLDNIKLNIIGNINYDPQALEELSCQENIILVETAGNSSYQEIEQELEICSSQKINILGVIIIA